MLSKPLQAFSRFWPMSSTNQIISYYLTGNAGFNATSTSNILFNITISLAFFLIGLVIYTKFCWKKE